MSSNNICGARIGNILGREARFIASKLYEQFRRRDDCHTVARNTGFSIEQVNKVYNYQKAADAYYISIGIKVQ